MSDEPDFDDEPYRGTQILWGRVVVLLLALALAFWLGTTFGGDASLQRQVAEQRAEITRLESEITALEAEVAAVDAGGAERETSAPTEPDDDDEGGDGDGQPTAEQGETEEPDSGSEYMVQSGDSLASIAQEVYGDPTLWRDIAQANDLSEPYSLSVGDTLDIPERP